MFIITTLGSGASCIYPLLGARLNNWHFLATEVDETSISYANDNVKSNGLENNIKGKDYKYFADVFLILFCVLHACILFCSCITVHHT